MAIYHLSVKTVSRSAGRSATAAAAYRAGVEITDERTGEIHDYTRKGGVESAELVLPAGAPEWAADRAALWNAAEQAEARKNSTVAREFEIALPGELCPAERQRLARDLAREIVERHGCAADVAIHAPGKEGDNRNHHAHILLSTRRLGPEGFTEKTRELDDQKTGPQIVAQWRERFATLQNERLREVGIAARVDHRSLDAQGIDREPTRHLGPAASGYERRTGQPSAKRLQQELEASERLARAKAAGELERQSRQIDRLILDLESDLSAALAERDRQQAAAKRERILAALAQQKVDQAQRQQQACEEAERRELAAKAEQWFAAERKRKNAEREGDIARQARVAEIIARAEAAKAETAPPELRAVDAALGAWQQAQTHAARTRAVQDWMLGMERIEQQGGDVAAANAHSRKALGGRYAAFMVGVGGVARRQERALKRARDLDGPSMG